MGEHLLPGSGARRPPAAEGGGGPEADGAVDNCALQLHGVPAQGRGQVLLHDMHHALRRRDRAPALRRHGVKQRARRQRPPG